MKTKEHLLLIVGLMLCITSVRMLDPGTAMSQDSQAVLNSQVFQRYFDDYIARTSQEDLYGLKEYLKSALEDAILDSMSQVNPISLDADIRYFTEKLQRNMEARLCPSAQPGTLSGDRQRESIVRSVKDTADGMGLDFRNSAYGRISAILTNILRAASAQSICGIESLLQLP